MEDKIWFSESPTNLGIPTISITKTYGNYILVFGSPEWFVHCVFKITLTPTVRDICTSLRSFFFFFNFGLTTHFASHLFVKGTYDVLLGGATTQTLVTCGR